AELEGSALVADPQAPAAVNVRELRRVYDRLTRLPRQLVEEVVHTTSLAQQEWTVARQNADFAHFRPWLERIVVLKKQEADALGFHRGRLDTTPHPFFSSIGPGDCRITTRFQAHNFCDGFFAILHEVGHGLYEQGLDPEHHGTPMGEAVSLGMHEAQSRLWEN